MKHADHVNLLRPAELPAGGVWADFGAGSGAFTLALRELLGAGSQLHAIDRARGSLSQLKDEYQARFGDDSNLHIISADFSRPLSLPALDGALMANSLHYFREKHRILRHIRSFLKPGGALLLVEYNVDSGNLWVPYPLSFDTWKALAPQAGFSEPDLLATHGSHFLRQFYSALCHNSDR